MCGHFFDHGIGKVIAQALPIAAAFIPGVGPIASAALSAGAGALGARLQGGNFGDVLKSAALSGLGNVAAPVMGNAFSGAFPETASALGIAGNADTAFGSGFGNISGAAPTGLSSYGINAGVGQGFDAAGNSTALSSPNTMSFGTTGPGEGFNAAANAGGQAASSSAPNSMISNLISKISNNPLQALSAGVTLSQALGGNQVKGEQTQQDILNQIQQQKQQAAQYSKQSTDMLNSAASGRSPVIPSISDYYTYGQRPEALFFNKVNTPIKYAEGGSVEKDSQQQKYKESAMKTRALMDNHRMRDTASFVIDKYLSSSYPGSLSHFMTDEYGDVPITKEIQANEHGNYAKGGYVSGGVLSGGQDDDVDAKLSNGEFVVPADVVSGLGDGTNEAGAAKLHKMMNGVRKHKTGRTKFPPKAKSIGSYMGALSHG